MTDIVEFPSRKYPDLLVGPFEYWQVVVDGRAIPNLTGRKTEDGGINLIVDKRFMAGPFYGDTANQVAWLVAQAMAIGAGYSDLSAVDKSRPFAPEIHRIEIGEDS